MRKPLTEYRILTTTTSAINEDFTRYTQATPKEYSLMEYIHGLLDNVYLHKV